jgi:transcriptional regulator with XRE-family HTH domain
MPKDENKIAERLLKILDQRRMTRAELAKRMGIAPSHLSMMLNGSRRWHMEKLSLAAVALGVDVLVLLGGEEPSRVSGRVCFELEPVEMKQLLSACADELRTPENLAAWVVTSWLRSRR